MLLKNSVLHFQGSVKCASIRLMNLLLIALTTFYFWVYFRTHFESLPDWLIHFIILPGIAIGLSFWSTWWLTAIAACGIVLLIDTAAQRAAPKAKERPRKRSNIPPPP